MKAFVQLFTKISLTTKTNDPVIPLVEYFEQATEADKLWAIALLTHHRPKRIVSTTLLKKWALEISELPHWLFDESYQLVGDLTETIALILPVEPIDNNNSLSYWINYIKNLVKLTEIEKKEKVATAWNSLKKEERLIFNKLITGGFRVSISQKLMVEALAKYTQQAENILSHKLTSDWTPETTTFKELIFSKSALDDISNPYPFHLAYHLTDFPNTLGDKENWQAERKWDGIRGQIIIRDNSLFTWSRGAELITKKLPEYHSFSNLLPNGTVIDGEILAFKDGSPLPLNILEARLGRKNLTKKHLQEAPVVLVAYDLLELESIDIRSQPLSFRRKQLEALIKNIDTNGVLLFSGNIDFKDWDDLEKERANARQYHSEGLMLKRKDSLYQSGRKKGDWWKWKVEPLVIDAVMLYAQKGDNSRRNLYTHFTFALWENDQLIPFTKASLGLEEEELKEIADFVKKNTVERFGPVRSIQPALVFEIEFEGIQESARHKSGVVLKHPKIKRWRKEKLIDNANTLKDLKDLLKLYFIK